MTATLPAAPPELSPATIGRDEELVELRRRLGEASLGRGSLTFLVAEAGVGKSRLVDEIADVSRSREIAVVHGRGATGGERVSCDLFSGVLAGLAASGQRQAVHELLAETLPHLWPRVFAEAAPPDEAADLQPELRHRLFVSRLASLLSEREPTAALLVCLEDLHTADSASLEVLNHLAQEIAAAPVMVVASLRPAGPETEPPLMPLVEQLHRHPHVHRLDLGPLDTAQTRALVASCFDREGLADEFFEQVHRRSGGVPLHVLQLLALFIERGIVHEEHGLWVNRRLDDDEVPASVRGALQERLKALSEADRDLLGLAAIQGSRFQGVLLAQTLAQSPPRTLKQLTEIARKSRLIQPTGDGFRFSHPLIAELLYHSRSESQRRHVHLRLAYILERDYPRHPEALAHHLFEAGLHERALPALVAAARRAIDTFGYREARALLTKAERSCGALGATAPPDLQLEALVLQAEVEDRLGDRQRSLEAAGAVLGRAGDDATIAGRALLQMAQVRRRQGQWEEAGSLYDRALDHFVRAGDEGLTAKTQIGLGNLAFERSDLEGAQTRFDHARDIAQRLQDHGLLGATYGNLGVLATVRGDSMQAVLHYTEAIKSYSRAHHRYGICQTHHNLGMCYAQQGEWDEALATYERGETLAEKLGTLDVLANIRVNKALALARTGKLDEAEATNARAASLMQRLGDRLGVAECQKVDGMVLAARGRVDEARSRLTQGRDACLTLDNELGAAECDVELAELDIAARLPAEARQRLQAAADLFERVGAAAEAQRSRQRAAELA